MILCQLERAGSRTNGDGAGVMTVPHGLSLHPEATAFGMGRTRCPLVLHMVLGFEGPGLMGFEAPGLTHRQIILRVRVPILRFFVPVVSPPPPLRLMVCLILLLWRPLVISLAI